MDGWAQLNFGTQEEGTTGGGPLGGDGPNNENLYLGHKKNSRRALLHGENEKTGGRHGTTEGDNQKAEKRVVIQREEAKHNCDQMSSPIWPESRRAKKEKKLLGRGMGGGRDIRVQLENRKKGGNVKLQLQTAVSKPIPKKSCETK